MESGKEFKGYREMLFQFPLVINREILSYLTPYVYIEELKTIEDIRKKNRKDVKNIRLSAFAKPRRYIPYVSNMSEILQGGREVFLFDSLLNQKIGYYGECTICKKWSQCQANGACCK